MYLSQTESDKVRQYFRLSQTESDSDPCLRLPSHVYPVYPYRLTLSDLHFLSQTESDMVRLGQTWSDKVRQSQTRSDVFFNQSQTEFTCLSLTCILSQTLLTRRLAPRMRPFAPRICPLAPLTQSLRRGRKYGVNVALFHDHKC